MKRITLALLCALSALFIFAGCNKDNKDDQHPLGNKTWTELVKEYPFLSEFPAFDGEIENVVHNNTMGLESVAFFDYKCDKSVTDTYFKKFASTDFEKSEYADIYKKKSGGKTYIFTGGYAAGNFALSFSVDGTN
ncbi:MAG: hypothetical protein ACI3ZQ_06330 [Candidatus Cryptobacteroides sp.]